ncbi:hypothetical protein SETIT_6G066600v2 [Setaria italica]|uniref:Pectinesterase inhibitor domain-containing protein n=1 Tax=Setaria italica TaxID=4555 RepID=A0A368RIR6_SETIT|nr:hypothetical protein SETIT_6G066600v2 [Setaria italica]
MAGAALTLVAALAAAMSIVGGEACNQGDLMKWNEACLMAAGNTVELYNLCQEMLQHAPDAAEMSEYARLAARFTNRSYSGTVAAAQRLLAGGSIPAGQRPAYRHCVERYSTASAQMASVMAELASCDYGRLKQRYVDAKAAMESCGRELAAGTPLAAMNAADKAAAPLLFADRDMTRARRRRLK